MGRFIVRRSLSAIALLLATSFLVFSFFELIPNYNPARAIAGRNANQTTVNQVAKKFDLNKPFYVQYANTMKLIFTGQVIDYQNDLNVVDQFRQRFPVTLSLVIPAAIIWLVMSVLLGSISAVRVGRFTDKAVMVAAIIGVSVPIFLLAALLLYLFAYKWAVFPNTGYTNFATSPTQWAYHLILPWISIAVLSIGFYSRVLRSNLLDTVNQDYVRTARAKGLSENRIMWIHVLRNASIPIITNLMANLPGLLLGAFLIERFFSIPGIGREVILAVERSDFPVIKALTVYVAFATMASNLLADLMYKAVDPRVQLT
jgi:peptide/nickel transport system permease protein